MLNLFRLIYGVKLIFNSKCTARVQINKSYYTILEECDLQAGFVVPCRILGLDLFNKLQHILTADGSDTPNFVIKILKCAIASLCK